MNSDVLSAQIAKELSSLWDVQKAKQFLHYLETTFGVNEKHEPIFQCFYIGETEDGDLKSGPSGAIIKHWWQVNDSGITEIKIPKMDWDGSPFYATPKMLFFVEGDSIAIVEIYGQKNRYWKRGKIAIIDSLPKIISIEVMD
jgi:hypothetical protein